MAQNGFTRFKLGDVSGPHFEGPANDVHVYVFTAEFERPGHLKNETTRIAVRLRDIQTYNRDPEDVTSLARWIAMSRVLDRGGADAPPDVVDATDEEVADFFEHADAKKVAGYRDRWVDLPPAQRPIGF